MSLTIESQSPYDVPTEEAHYRALHDEVQSASRRLVSSALVAR